MIFSKTTTQPTHLKGSMHGEKQQFAPRLSLYKSKKDNKVVLAASASLHLRNCHYQKSFLSFTKFRHFYSGSSIVFSALKPNTISILSEEAILLT